MRYKNYLPFALAALGLLGLAWQLSPQETADTPQNFEAVSVWDVVEALGGQRLHEINPKIKGASADKGREIVFSGITTDPSGKPTKKQSEFFTCTSCHNPVKDQFWPTDIDAASKLAYSAKHNLPILPANSLYGMVNRSTFYNDDYQKKYGHVKTIAKAKNDLRQAIQVCATECSQGRAMADWEIESVLAYLWTLELKISDLDLKADEKKRLEATHRTKTKAEAELALIQSKYLSAYPAHFIDPPAFKKLSENELRDAERYNNGRLVYELSCKHCHANKRFSTMLFDDRQETFQKLNADLQSQDPHSFIVAIRQGIPADKVKKTSYMPQYTKEHLSNEQLMDLRIYVENNARYGSIADNAELDAAACNQTVNYQKVKALLDEKCLNCHNSYLAPDFTSYSTMRESLEKGSFDMRVFVRKDMPIGEKLSNEELQLLLCWKNAGYPEQ